MIRERPVKVIKQQERNAEKRKPLAESARGSNIWSTSVRLWVQEYRQASVKRLPAFDRLFKNPPIPVND